MKIKALMDLILKEIIRKQDGNITNVKNNTCEHEKSIHENIALISKRPDRSDIRLSYISFDLDWMIQTK